MEERERCLHFFAELKANGADDQDMFFICAVLFGERFDSDKTSNELKNVNNKPATTETVKADLISVGSILSQSTNARKQKMLKK